MIAEDALCCICRKGTTNLLESHAIKISYTTTDLDFNYGTPILQGTHEEFVLCTEPCCRIALLQKMIDEAEDEIIEKMTGKKK